MNADPALKTYYVYKHVDPRDGSVVYIGHGWKSRAWVHGSSKAITRSDHHYKWLEEINSLGYLPCDYVQIYKKALSKSEACTIECERIRKESPKFNRPQGLSMLKVNPEIMAEMRNLRSQGFSYKYVASAVGVSTMTAHRALTGKTKNAK